MENNVEGIGNELILSITSEYPPPPNGSTAPWGA
jgi:hypothetical protein